MFTDSQVSYTSWFLDALNYAIHLGVDVLNLRCAIANLIGSDSTLHCLPKLDLTIVLMKMINRSLRAVAVSEDRTIVTNRLSTKCKRCAVPRVWHSGCGDNVWFECANTWLQQVFLLACSNAVAMRCTKLQNHFHSHNLAPLSMLQGQC